MPLALQGQQKRTPYLFRLHRYILNNLSHARTFLRPAALTANVTAAVYIKRPIKMLSTRMGFEPTRAEHIGLAVQRLNHSATSSNLKEWQNYKD